MARYIGAGADVLVLVRVEGLAVLGEVPLDGLVHELAVTGAQVEGDHGGGLLPAGRDRLVRPDIVAGPGGLGLRAARAWFMSPPLPRRKGAAQTVPVPRYGRRQPRTLWARARAAARAVRPVPRAAAAVWH